jgi:hypothetical protein
MAEKITMFRARDCSWRAPLVKLEADRVSESSVWIRGRRVARESGDHISARKVERYFEHAKAWLLGQLMSQISKHTEEIEALQKRIAAIEPMTEDSIPVDNDIY